MKRLLGNTHVKTILTMLLIAFYVFLCVVTEGAVFAITIVIVFFVMIYLAIYFFIRDYT